MISDYKLGDIDGKLDAYMESVKLGCKPVASIMFPREFLAHVVETIAGADLYLIAMLSGEWATVYFFKEPELADVLVVLQAEDKDIREAALQWVTGKMYGYGDQEIAGFIKGAGE